MERGLAAGQQEFELPFDETLGKDAPLKSVTIRGNNKPHMTKSLRKAMMLRTHLKIGGINQRSSRYEP